MTNQLHFPLTDRRPDEIIAFRDTGEIQVSHFLAQVNALCRQLPSHQYVINLCSDRYQYLLGFCAAVVAGQCTLMPPNNQAITLEQVSEDYPDSYSLGENGLSDYKMSPGDHSDNAVGVHNAAVPEIEADQLCVIAFTSGSTGTPTPNPKYWETLRTGAISDAALLLEEMPDNISLLATVPPQHMWGFEASILLPLFASAAVSHLAPFYPQDIADALESLPAPRVLISSPIHLNALLKSGVQLARLQEIFSATAPLSKEQAKELEDAFSTRVLELFGCSETGMLAARFTSTETLWRTSAAFEFEAKTEGVVIRAQHLPEEVVLPDLIELTGDNRFRWLGRHEDMINIAGKRGSISDLNRRLMAISGVVDGVIFMPEGSPKRLAAMVVAPELTSSDILGKLKPQIEPVFLPRPVYMVSALPRQETGKMSKRLVMELFEETRKKRILENSETTDVMTSDDGD
jgi:acyl-coenzyme A synthetase/AMP-(fatty) acid ligase